MNLVGIARKIRHNIANGGARLFSLAKVTAGASARLESLAPHVINGKETLMKSRFILVMLGMAALAVLSLGLQAQEKVQTPDKEELFNSEQQLARQFAEFQDALLRLKQRLARGTPEEKKRAETLDKVLDLCKELAINQEFTKMIEVIRTANLKNTDDVDRAREMSDSLSGRLTKVLNLLRDSNTDQISQQRRDLERIIRDLEKNIAQQRQVEARTERNRSDPEDLKRDQKETSATTEKIENAIQEYLDPKGAENAKLKGENKEGGKTKGQGEAKDAGDPKQATARGEAKDPGKESKGAKGEAKAAQEAKAGDPKSGQEPKSGSKAGEKSGSPKDAGAKGDPKSGQKGPEASAKENQPGDPKAGKGQEGSAKDSGKPGEPKQGQQGSAKGGEDKKPMGDKNGSPSQAKAGGDKPGGEPKAGDPKGAQGAEKSGDSKTGDVKGAQGDPKAGDSKAGASKDGQGQAKDGGSPSKGGGDPMSGSPPQAGQKGDPQASPPGNPSNKEKDDVANAKKKINEAGYDQAKAEDKIDKKDNAAAAKAQADAIQKMEEARKKLENLLRQMREEEIERVLAALQARCEKMLMMQQAVLVGTEDLDRVIQKNPDKKPDRLNKPVGLKLSDQEKDIVQEANKCIDILEAEGSAVAFPEVFQQIRQDMIHVQKRLELTDAGGITQGIEKDIIENLKEMIDALKKARQDNQSEPSKGGAGKSGQPGEQKLLELLQELKMVRALQKRVNDRTITYGKMFPNEEQARDPQIVRELRGLSERQLRIQEIVSKIAKGDNK